MSGFERRWYGPAGLHFLLLPLAWLFCGLAMLRRAGYRRGWLRSTAAPIPLIVVGNISVGGTGKTPLVIWLVKVLCRAGYRPGLVSRGYGGHAKTWPQWLDPQSEPAQVGDEAILLSRRCDCPMVVGPDRVAAVTMLLTQSDCNIVISDDGMQHYAMKRDMEIAVIDGLRRFGNGHCLPVGPLRERPSRLQQVDFVVANGPAQGREFAMHVSGNRLHNLKNHRSEALSNWADRTVHALAGLGNPERFFRLLRAEGLHLIEHQFPDHYPYQPKDLQFGDTQPLVMTEKDAVKCQRIAGADCWYLPVQAKLPASLAQAILEKLAQIAKKPTNHKERFFYG